MNVLLVCNNAFIKGNGLSTAVRMQHRLLREAGVDARILAMRNDDPEGEQPEFPLEHLVIPVFESILKSQGFGFAKANRKAILAALEWADVVHIEEPFLLEEKVIRLARKLRKPCVATFHLFTQNIMDTIGLGEDKVINEAWLALWKRRIYNKCSYIHCPTETVADILASHRFKAHLMTFSNGVTIPDERIIAQVPEMDPFIIICIGRMSKEKAQTTLLKAMKYSRHADRIQLVFAGKGPLLEKIERKADRLYEKGVLKLKPTFGFYNHEQLRELVRKSYLYIHCAWVEVEGLSCLESLREGTVPVIAKGPLTATSKFALDKRSIYRVKNPWDLASKIDWWIDHPEERIEMGQKYADKVREYDVHNSTLTMIEMYRRAIEDARKS